MMKYKINVMKWNLEKYNTTPLSYHKFQILLLMENANTHLVSLFKDYLLFDDSTEFFKEYYHKKEIYPRLKTIFDYYESSSYLFPNYTAINEGKYIYRNIIRKQKLIDYLEDLEDQKKEKEEKKNNKMKKKLKNQTKNEQSSSSYIEVFDTKIYENIRKETENDSKINELFCVGNKNNNDCDSFASIIKLTEELKEKEKVQEKAKEKDKDKEIEKKNDISNKNISYDKYSNNNNNNSNINKKANKNSENNEKEGKIYVSRRVNFNQNSKVYNKKTINKGVKNLNINNFINNNNSGGLITRNYNLTDRNKNINKLNGDPSKSNDFIKSNQNNFNSNKNIKTNYKKNNIIINIINNNKNNNYNSTNNYFSNNTNTNANTNINEININNNINFKTEINNLETNNNLGTTINTDKNINKNTSNIAINNSQNTKIILTNPKNTSNNSNTNKNKVNKNIQNNKKFFKSKLLSFRLTDCNFIRNITEKLKSKSNSNSIKKSKNKSKTKSVISPMNNKTTNHNNVKKRTKTEIIGNKTDIFIFGHQGDNNPYNKSINRQILKNINLTNNSKPHKDISLVNKKIINYHFNINNINNNNINHNNKIIKHTSTNSQNLTNVKIINRIAPFSAREMIKTKGVGVGAFSVNKTERTSRNHSKDKIIKINNTTLKKNYLDSFSPQKAPDLIYNKIHKIKNKTNENMYTFWKSISSYKKAKNVKIKKNNNYTNVNNNYYYQGINSARNNKDMAKRINIPKNL